MPTLDREEPSGILSQDLPRNRPLANAVLALDVIEHIDDDRAALARIATLLRPGGIAIVSVPACRNCSRISTKFSNIAGVSCRISKSCIRSTELVVRSHLLVERMDGAAVATDAFTPI